MGAPGVLFRQSIDEANIDCLFVTSRSLNIYNRLKRIVGQLVVLFN